MAADGQKIGALRNALAEIKVVLGPLASESKPLNDALFQAYCLADDALAPRKADPVVNALEKMVELYEAMDSRPGNAPAHVVAVQVLTRLKGQS